MHESNAGRSPWTRMIGVVAGCAALLGGASNVFAEASVDALTLLQTPSTPPAAGTDNSLSAPSPSAAIAPAPADAAAVQATAPTAVARIEKFGAKDSWRFDVEGDWIYNWENATFAQGRVGFAWFFFENIEWAFYGTFGYVWQPGSNAVAGGFDMEMRWHFLAYEDWSLFASIGASVLGSTHSVPENGSPFNFTPTVGIGATFAVAENTRLYVSARWYHISNAGTYDHNPGRDSTSLWLGLSFGM